MGLLTPVLVAVLLLLLLLLVDSSLELPSLCASLPNGDKDPALLPASAPAASEGGVLAAEGAKKSVTLA
jgi:hypothetical protein